MSRATGPSSLLSTLTEETASMPKPLSDPIIDGNKICTSCQGRFPATFEYFEKNSKRACGLNTRCKRCKNSKQLIWQSNHRDKCHLYSNQWYQKNAKRHMENHLKWNKEHPEKPTIYHETWAKNNKTHLRNYAKKRREEFPELNQQAMTIRRARKANAPINDFTHAQWTALQVAFDHRCAYCGKRAKGHLTQDHVQPLSKGGSHTLSNIVPACKSCNSRKHAGAPLIPVQPMLLLA